MVVDFAEHLKTTGISVSTHNRKIIRLRKIFETLQDYRSDGNPFAPLALRCKEREEQGTSVRRQAFTREQEEAIRRELDNPARTLLNKAEIKVVYYIGMYTGQRLKDCVLMQWQNIDMQKKRIWVKQFKTGEEVSLPIAEPLFEVLKEAGIVLFEVSHPQQGVMWPIIRFNIVNSTNSSRTSSYNTRSLNFI